MASEVRVNKLTNRSGLGTATFNDDGSITVAGNLNLNTTTTAVRNAGVSTATGALIAMSAGGGPYTPPGQTVLHPAPVFHQQANSSGWVDVSEGFPAAHGPPTGVAVTDWDDDGDREGRFLCPVSQVILDYQACPLWYASA